MKDLYAFIIADLIKRNTELHGHALEKRGHKYTWPADMRKICIRELRANSYTDRRIKSFTGFLWQLICKEDLTTRMIYQLLLHFFLVLEQEDNISIHTENYLALLQELKISIEGGVFGEVEDISEKEMKVEWELMKTDYYPALSIMCEDWIKEYLK